MPKGSRLAPMGGFLAVTVIIGLVGLLYARYRNLPEQIGEDSVPAHVVIVDPGPGLFSQAGEPVVVSAQSAGPAPLLSLEIWANDMLVGVEAAPTTAGVDFLFANVVWQPQMAGNYSLRARAIDAEGKSTDSDLVWVLIGEQEYVEDPAVSDDDNTIMDVPSGGGEGDSAGDLAQPPSSPPSAPPSPPSPDTPVIPAEPWTPDPGGLIDWVLDQGGALQTPELTLAAEGCKIVLQIHDLSEGELGFRVFRTEFGQSQSPVPSLTLAANPGTGWLKAEDVVSHASTFTYVVEAFNGDTTSPSSIPSTTTLDPESCPPPEGGPPPLLINLDSLLLQGAADQFYCYFSKGDGPWLRWPSDGFFPAGAENSAEFHGQLLGLLPLSESNEQGKKLTWECWGWGSGQLTSLGKFQFDLYSAQSGPLELTSSDGLGQMLMSLGVGLGDIAFPMTSPVVDPNLLAPTAYYSSNTSDCKSHLPGTVKPDFRDAWCHPGDSVSTIAPGDLSLHPHAYFYWDLSNKTNCEAPGQCVDPSDTDSLADGGYLFYEDAGYMVFDLHESEWVPVATFSGFAQRVYIVPPKGPCGTLRFFQVRTFVQQNGTVYVSPSPVPANTSIRGFYEPCSPDMLVEIEVTFTTLEFDSVDDGDLDPGEFGTEDSEVYGYVDVVPQKGYGDRLKLGQWDWSDSICHGSESISSGFTGSGPENGCPTVFTEGKFSFADLFLCRASFDNACKDGFSQNHNTATIIMPEGSPGIVIGVVLMDYDDGSANDTVCKGQVVLHKDAGSTWANTLNGAQWWLGQGNNGHASCTVRWTTSVVGP